MRNLYEASAQWATRPDDERFASLDEMRQACKAYAASAIQAGRVSLKSLNVEARGNDLALVGGKGIPARLTHYAFGQLARMVKAPAEYVRALPAPLAASCINAGLQQTDPRNVNLLFHKSGDNLVTRALTSESYDRVWNWEVIEKIQQGLRGWRVPPARPARPGQAGTRKATEADIMKSQGDFGLSVKVGDNIAPAGLYASDHDMFAFLVNEDDPVYDGQKYLNRGVFWQNSEVGDCALKAKLFTYDNVCGNHIVWGVGEVVDISIRHMKSRAVTSGRTLSKGMANWQVVSQKLPSGEEMSKQIHKAQVYQIADTKENVLDTLFKFGKSNGLSRLTKTTLEAAYDVAERTPRYGSPRSAWGMVNGLTEVSQGSHTDSRNELDVQAGRILEMAF